MAMIKGKVLSSDLFSSGAEARKSAGPLPGALQDPFAAYQQVLANFGVTAPSAPCVVAAPVDNEIAFVKLGAPIARTVAQGPEQRARLQDIAIALAPQHADIDALRGALGVMEQRGFLAVTERDQVLGNNVYALTPLGRKLAD